MPTNTGHFLGSLLDPRLALTMPRQTRGPSRSRILRKAGGGADPVLSSDRWRRPTLLEPRAADARFNKTANNPCCLIGLMLATWCFEHSTLPYFVGWLQTIWSNTATNAAFYVRLVLCHRLSRQAQTVILPRRSAFVYAKPVLPFLSCNILKFRIIL
jgi:hypothetical protein